MRNVSALSVASRVIVNSRAEPSGGFEAASRRAAVIAAEAKLRRRMRRRATLGWPLPARHSRYVTTTVSTVQCTMKAAMYAENSAVQGSSSTGKCTGMNVQSRTTMVIPPR